MVSARPKAGAVLLCLDPAAPDWETIAPPPIDLPTLSRCQEHSLTQGR